MGTYTARELERDTGFGRRTIAYYVQEGLLPRVGRRGPRTRYPELVRDRLLFIRRIREAEAEGKIAPVPLSDLRKLFLHAPPQLIASIAAGETPVTADIVSPISAERRAMVDRVSALKDRLSRGRYQAAEESPSFFRERGERTLQARDELILPRLEAPRNPMLMDESVADPDDPETLGYRLSEVLKKLQVQARRRRERSPDTVDTWSQIEITSEIRLSVRGMADQDALLLKFAGRLLRQLLESGPSSADGGSRTREE